MKEEFKGYRFDVEISAADIEDPQNVLTNDNYYIQEVDEGILYAINSIIEDYGYTYLELHDNYILLLDGKEKEFYLTDGICGTNKVLYHEGKMFFPKEVTPYLKEFFKKSKDEQKNILAEANDFSEMNWLRKKISQYDKAYEAGSPLITDTEYDKKYDELVKLEEKLRTSTLDSPTSKIENAKIKKASIVTYDIPMLSQEKSHTKEDLEAFLNRTNDNKYIIDVKLDGISIMCSYKNGKLVQASTRGNGQYGYDITEAVLKMDNVPKILNNCIDIDVRGEIIINNDDFENINIDGQFKNSRNLVAGTIGCLDTSLVKERKLKIIFYDIRNQKINTEEAHNLLKDLGFEVVLSKTFTNKKELIDYCLEFNNKYRQTLNYKIDGLVIKSNDFNIINKLGYTNKYPKSSIAFKFDSEDRTTILKEVIWQVGRTGQITPVAKFEIIEIDGVELEKASLANINNINKKDIRIGDTIVVARSNDVIPQVISVVKENRTGREKEITLPTNCPICGGNIKRINDLIFCDNENCQGKTYGNLIHFCKRDSMNIDSLSEKTIIAFIENNIPLTSVLDLYSLKNYRDNIEQIDGFKPQINKGIKTTKKIDKILLEIEKSKNNTLSQLLGALPIPNIGYSASKIIANYFLTLEKLNNEILNNKNIYNIILGLQDFGEVQTNGLINYFNQNQNVILGFLNLGKFEEPIKILSSKKLDRINFVITGTLSNSRGYFEKLIEDNGGKTSSSVSVKTNYLLLGDEPGISSKHQKAIDLNIKIINESELENLLK